MNRRWRILAFAQVIGDPQHWEPPKVATAIQLAKGLVSDGEPDLGDSGVVEL